MLKSMTGFAKTSLNNKKGSFDFEITSVNKRFLEINVFMDSIFSSFEYEIRKMIQKKLFRGQVNLKLKFYPDKSSLSYLPSLSNLKVFKKSLEKLSCDLGYKKEDITLEFLLKEVENLQKDILDVKDCKLIILKGVEDVLKNILSMKEKEGKALLLDLKKRILKIQGILSLIQKRIPFLKKEFKSKLKAKFDEIFTAEYKELEDRILKELALFSEKIDVTEEITRLDIHLKHFLSLIQSKEDTLGRKLDFLLQELLREINTLSSKILDANISKKAVEIKAEMEKIKEQIQNIE